MPYDMELIFAYVKLKRGFDLSGYRTAFVESRIRDSALQAGYESAARYVQHLKANDPELDRLLAQLTVNVSRFFRDPLTFCYLDERVIPEILNRKRETGNRLLRIWSAGCASGEEPYSVAILLDEHLCKEERPFELNLFATDVDPKAVALGKTAAYDPESLENVSFKRMNQYFTQKQKRYSLNPAIQRQVLFSVHDLSDERSSVPPESIYGDFDILLCRNVLIYFDLKRQERIFEKFLRAVPPGGYLVLGEVEMPPPDFRRHFTPVNPCCRIYQRSRF